MTNTGVEIIPLKELRQQLRLTDMRSVRRYCLQNGIAILKDNGSRSSYVMRSDYEAGRMRAFIRLLKKRHGKDWIKAYQAHVDFNIELLSALQGASREDQSNKNTVITMVVNTGSNEQRFLDELNSL